VNHISSKATDVKSRLDPRVERSRSALRDALLALLEGQPFDQLTVRDITARAGAGYATFFRHYPDKASLLADLAASEINDLLAQALPILDAVDTRASCNALCAYVDSRRRLWSVLLTGGAASNLREEFLRQARAIAAAHAPSADRQSSWLPDDLAVVFGVSGTVEILAWWLKPGNSHSASQTAGILDRLVIAPILQLAQPGPSSSSSKAARRKPAAPSGRTGAATNTRARLKRAAPESPMTQAKTEGSPPAKRRSPRRS